MSQSLSAKQMLANFPAILWGVSELPIDIIMIILNYCKSSTKMNFKCDYELFAVMLSILMMHGQDKSVLRG